MRLLSLNLPVPVEFALTLLPAESGLALFSGFTCRPNATHERGEGRCRLGVWMAEHAGGGGMGKLISI